MTPNEILAYPLFGPNTVWRIGAALLCWLAGFCLGKLFQYFLKKRVSHLSEQQQSIAQVTAYTVANSLPWILLTTGICASKHFLVPGMGLREFIHDLTNLLWIGSLGQLTYQMVIIPQLWLSREISGKRQFSPLLVTVVTKGLRLTVLVVIFSEILQQFSQKPISSLVAGLGIGGLAVALAAQNSLSNFFASLVIFSDKPFEIGEFIAVNGSEGAVHSLGLRSTRLITTDGKWLIIPNSILAGMTITNLSRKPFMFRKLELSLALETSAEKVEQALIFLKTLFNEHEGRQPTRPAQIFLSDVNTDGIILTIKYWYHPANELSHQRFVERLFLEILKGFSNLGINLVANQRFQENKK